jgi:3-hydroxyisobutyrate dehydrogenase
MAHVAVIGAGRIGLPVCARLVAAGHSVVAVDIAPDRVDLARRAGARTHDDAAIASQQADLVLTSLPGSPELRALMLGEHGDAGLIAQLQPGTAWVDLTSASPALGRDLAVAASAHELPMLDAPVGGGVDAAEQGRLTLFVGGDPAVLQRVRHLLEPFAAGDRILHNGPSGSGYLTKLLVNLLWFSQALSTAEALLLAQAAGLNIAQLRDVLLESAAASEFIKSYLPALLSGDYLASFALVRCVEELESLTEEAARLGVAFELSSLVADVHTRALRLFGQVDGELMGVAYLEDRSGRLLRTGGARPSPTRAT